MRLSGVLWLEVTGVFFGLFAVVALGYLWKLRGAWHANAPNTTDRHSLIGAAIMFVLLRILLRLELPPRPPPRTA